MQKDKILGKMSKLLSILSEDSPDLEEITFIWWLTYAENQKKAVVELICLLYCVAGAKSFDITSDDLQSPSKLFTRIVTENYTPNNDGVSDELLSKFISLIDNILLEGAFTLFKNSSLMYIILTTLSSFGQSNWESYRLISSIFGTKMMTALLALDDEKKKELECLKNKLKSLNATDFEELNTFNVIADRIQRLKEIQTKKEEISERIKQLQDEQSPNNLQVYLLQLFQCVFLEALRSTEVSVRKYCHRAMNVWMNFISLDYFKNKYLSLYHQLINDPDEQLRALAVKNYFLCLQNHLQPTISETNLTDMVRRLVRLSYDCFDVIKIYAVKCLNIIDRWKPNLIKPKMAEKLYYLVYYKERKVAAEAGNFLHRRLVAITGMNSVDYIRNVAYFHQESPESYREDFLIDTLINKSLLIIDWEGWTKLLLDSNDDHDTEVIMQLLHCTIKQANTGMVPFDRQSTKKKITKSIMLKNIEASSEHFKDAISNIWEKYKRKYTIFCPLVSCIPYMDFKENRTYLMLNQMLRLQLITSDNLAVKNDCCRTFAVVCKKVLSAEIDVNDVSDRQLMKCIKVGAARISDILEKQTDEIIEMAIKGNLTEADESLIKTIAFSSWQDIMENNIWQLLYMEMKSLMEKDKNRYEQFIQLFMQICYMSIFWISVYFTKERMNTNVVAPMFLEKLEFISRTFFLRLDATINEDHNGRKAMAIKIISNLQKVSQHINKYKGIPFLIYENVV